jgi:hypothetical protein
MKKNKLLFIAFIAFIVSFWSCKHAPILPDIEYFDGAVFEKIDNYWNGFISHDYRDFNINFEKNGNGVEQLHWSFHNFNGHTLDALKIEESPWFNLPKFSGSGDVSSSLSSDKDQIVSFQMRSKTPQNEIISGTVAIPKPMPMTIIDLGNNAFKIKWTPQRRGEKVLIYLHYFRYYVIRTNAAYAVETEDDGEHILGPSVFDRFKENIGQISLSNSDKEPVYIGLIRLNNQRKTTIIQPSTGIKYNVFGGSVDEQIIEVKK